MRTSDRTKSQGSSPLFRRRGRIEKAQSVALFSEHSEVPMSGWLLAVDSFFYGGLVWVRLSHFILLGRGVLCDCDLVFGFIGVHLLLSWRLFGTLLRPAGE